MMTKKEAEELVEDLLQAQHDYENNSRRSYREDYLRIKEQVVVALVDAQHTGSVR